MLHIGSLIGYEVLTDTRPEISSVTRPDTRMFFNRVPVSDTRFLPEITRLLEKFNLTKLYYSTVNNYHAHTMCK